jgi:hypothetical protein
LLIKYPKINIAEYEIEKMIKKSSIFSKKVKYVNIVVNNDIKIVR